MKLGIAVMHFAWIQNNRSQYVNQLKYLFVALLSISVSANDAALTAWLDKRSTSIEWMKFYDNNGYSNVGLKCTSDSACLDYRKANEFSFGADIGITTGRFTPFVGVYYSNVEQIRFGRSKSNSGWEGQVGFVLGKPDSSRIFRLTASENVEASIMLQISNAFSIAFKVGTDDIVGAGIAHRF